MKDVVLKGFGRKEEMESDDEGARARQQGGLRAVRPRRLPPEARGPQQGLDREARPVRLASGDDRAHQEARRTGRQDERRRPRSRRATRSSSPTSRCRIAEIAVVTEGAAGLAGGNGGGKKAETRAREEGREPSRPRPRAEEEGLRAVQALELRRRRQEAGAGRRIGRRPRSATPKSTRRAAAIRPSSRSR